MAVGVGVGDELELEEAAAAAAAADANVTEFKREIDGSRFGGTTGLFGGIGGGWPRPVVVVAAGAGVVVTAAVELF